MQPTSSIPPETEHDPQSLFFRRWGQFVLRYRWVLLALTLIIGGFFGKLAAERTRVDTSSEALLATDSAILDAIGAFWDAFGHDKTLMIVAEGDVFSMRYLQRLKALHDAVEGFDMELETLGEQPWERAERLRGGGGEPPKAGPPPVGAEGDEDFGGFGDDDGWGDEEGGSLFEEVTSLINVRQTRAVEDGIDVSGLLDEWPSEAQLPALKRRVLSDRNLVGQIVAAKGTHSLILARNAFMSPEDSFRLESEIQALAKSHSKDGFRVFVTGNPVIEASMTRYTVQDIGTVFSLAMLAMLVLLAVQFRHPIGVLGPVLVVVQSVCWTFGVMAITGAVVTPITAVLSSFLLCVGTGDAIHMQSVYRDARRRGLENNDAVVHALGSTGLPVFYTSFTTAIGLSSFLFAELGAIRDMGLYGAIGVAFALLHSLVFLPIMLSFNRTSLMGARPKVHGDDLLDRMLDFCDRLSRSRVIRGKDGKDGKDGQLDHSPRWRTLGITLLVVAGCFYSATHIRSSHDPIGWFPEGTTIEQDVREVDANIGGVNNIMLLIESDGEQDLRRQDLMQGLDELERRLLAYEGNAKIGSVTGVVDVVRETHRALHGGGDDEYRVPEQQREVVDIFTVFQNAGPEDLKRLMTIDARTAFINARMNWMDAAGYGPISAYMVKNAEELLKGVKIRATGSGFTMFSIVQALIVDLARSFSMALIVITLIMVLMLRDLKLGLLAMIPNLLPIVGCIGLMGVADIPLDLNTLLVASIAIGIAVDDTIHFLHQFGAHYRANGNVDAAIAHSFSHSGRAMVATTVVLAIGFYLFMFGALQNASRFGLLIGTSSLFALASDLLIAPAILRAFYRDRVAA